MTPKQVAKARRIIGKRWYRSWRIMKLKREFRRWDRILIYTTISSVGECCRQMERLAKKEAWYRSVWER